MLRILAAQDGRLEVQEDAPADALPPGALWLDLFKPTREEELSLEALLGLDIPTRAEAAAIGDSSRLYIEGKALVMTMPVVAGVSEGHRPTAADITFLLTPSLLLTIREADPLPFRAFTRKCEREPHVQASPEQVFLALVETVIDRAAELLDMAQAKLDKASAEIFADPDRTSNPQGQPHPVRKRPVDLRITVKQLGRINNLAARLRESLLGIGRMLAFFRRNALDRLPEAARARLGAMEADVRSLADYDAQLASELDFVLQAVFGLTNADQNKIIRVFTIASVLFLPPTLVGTVYGMNFTHMPELGWVFGYPMALGLMALSAWLPYWLFRRMGWL